MEERVLDQCLDEVLAIQTLKQDVGEWDEGLHAEDVPFHVFLGDALGGQPFVDVHVDGADLRLCDPTYRVTEDAGNSEDRVPRQTGFQRRPRHREELVHVLFAQVGRGEPERGGQLPELIGFETRSGRGIVGAQRRGGVEQLTAVGRLDVSVTNSSGEALGFEPDVLHVAAHDADSHDVDVVEQPVVLRVEQAERAIALHGLQRQAD